MYYFKVVSMIVVMVLVMTGITGCSTMGIKTKDVFLISAMFSDDELDQSTAWDYGHDAALAYLVVKDKIDPKHDEIVIKLWTAFDSSVNDYLVGVADSDDIEVITRSKLREATIDDVQYTKAMTLYNKVAEPLKKVLKIEKADADEIMLWIIRFRDGVEDGLEEGGKLVH